MDVTVDWTSAANPMGIYVVSANTCTLDQFNSRSCTFVVRSEPSTVKPRKVSTPSVPAGSYQLYTANFSEHRESVSFQVVSSQGECPALATGRGEFTEMSLPSVQTLMRQPPRN